MAIDAVVFDIGRVLIEWDPHRFYDARIGRTRREALFASVDLDGMNLGVDRGRPFRDSVFGLAEQHPEWRDEILHWHDSWLEMASPAIPHSVRLMRALKARGLPVYALTNFGSETFETARAAYPFFNEFDRAFVSARLKTIKPEPRIYEILEQETAAAPERLLFTDDRADNIAAAQARGWQTHLFTTPETLAARLVAEGLLSPEEAQ